MHTFRITKYDPLRRDADGAYRHPDWTSISDIGKEFNGKLLTEDEYARVESSYVEAAKSFLSEAETGGLWVKDLEQREFNMDFPEIVNWMDIGPIVRAMLREQIWCRLEGRNCYIHVGYDYYMYVGVPHACTISQSQASQSGLFVEEFISPYAE